MSDNPFAEPGDDDCTVIMPRASIRLAVSNPPEGVAEAQTVPDASGGIGFPELPAFGNAPVVTAAAALLSLLARLRQVVSVPDPASLRASAVLELRRYEQALRDARLPLEQIQTGHYALCASLDDVVQNTPWGSRGPWADASLVSSFHQEVRSGDRFFDLLTRLSQNAGNFLPVIELMYLCMSLGMQGRYRLSKRGPAELDRVREETYLIILRQRGTAEPALSPRWQGVAAPYRPLRFSLPVWLAALTAAGLLGLAFALVSLGLNGESDRSFEQALALPPGAMPVIARPMPPKPLPTTPQPDGNRLAGFLAPEIRQGLVSLVGTPALPVIRIQSAGMFASGSASLEPGILPILARVAAALKTRGGTGTVRIVGYTDDQPIHSVAFPSNFQLSLARAQAAGAALAGSIAPDHMAEEGRADADPVASNATPDGRQRNRRIEIVLGPQETP